MPRRVWSFIAQAIPRVTCLSVRTDIKSHVPGLSRVGRTRRLNLGSPTVLDVGNLIGSVDYMRHISRSRE